MALTLGIIFGLLAMLGWGLSDFLSKNAVNRIGAYKTFFYFYSTGAIITIILFTFFPKFSKLSAFLIFLFLIEAFLNLLGCVFFYKGMEKQKVSIVSPIVACNPVIVVLLSYFLLKEIIALPQIIAFILMISGLILISWEKKYKIESKKGIYLALSAMLIFGFSVFIFGYLIKTTNWLFALMIGRILTWVFSFSFFKLKKISFKVKSIIPLLILIGVLDIGAVISFSMGVSVSFVSLVSVISSLYPLIVLILSRIFFKEKLNLYQKIGVIIILLGLVLISF